MKHQMNQKIFKTEWRAKKFRTYLINAGKFDVQIWEHPEIGEFPGISSKKNYVVLWNEE